MSRITGVVVALATTAAVLSGSSAGAGHAPASAPQTAELPRSIPGGVELTLADGDLLRVWAADDDRAVVSRRRDAATGTWGPRLEVLRRRNLYCGEVEGRTADGAVALLAQCDRYGYSDDQAPVASRALWSPDGVTWSSYTLPGEGYEEPGISPDGRNAVWPLHGAYVTRTAAGFATHRIASEGQEYTVTATITDSEQVSFLYGGSLDGEECGLVVLTRTGDATPTRQVLALDSACSDGDLANVDADTTLFGWFGDPGQVAVISRPDAASPWAVTQQAPQDAPGLVLPERGPLHRQFFTAPGAPLVALGSRSGRRVRAQVYDTVAQAWGPATTVHTSPSRCRWGSWSDEVLGVLVAVVDCKEGKVALTTRDGRGWRALRMGGRPLGPSSDGRYVAVPGPTSTHVISPELGVVTLPTGSTGRCDVALPDGPQAAVRFVAAPGSRRWPTLLRRITADGATGLDRLPTPTSGRCAAAEGERLHDLPFHFTMRSTRMDFGQNVRIVRRGEGWQVRVKPW
jgi:hypothetical protein